MKYEDGVWVLVTVDDFRSEEEGRTETYTVLADNEDDGVEAVINYVEDTFGKTPKVYKVHVEEELGGTVEEETVTIPKDLYEKLQEDSEFLACLEAAGVDNWGGYGEACGMMEEDDDL